MEPSDVALPFLACGRGLVSDWDFDNIKMVKKVNYLLVSLLRSFFGVCWGLLGEWFQPLSEG